MKLNPTRDIRKPSRSARNAIRQLRHMRRDMEALAIWRGANNPQRAAIDTKKNMSQR